MKTGSMTRFWGAIVNMFRKRGTAQEAFAPLHDEDLAVDGLAGSLRREMGGGK